MQLFTSSATWMTTPPLVFFSLLPAQSNLLLTLMLPGLYASTPISPLLVTAFLGISLVFWKTKKQATVSCSSTEAKYRNMASTICKLLVLLCSAWSRHSCHFPNSFLVRQQSRFANHRESRVPRAHQTSWHWLPFGSRLVQAWLYLTSSHFWVWSNCRSIHQVSFYCWFCAISVQVWPLFLNSILRGLVASSAASSSTTAHLEQPSSNTFEDDVQHSVYLSFSVKVVFSYSMFL